MESGGRGIPGVRVLLLKATREKGRDPLERVREFAARVGEVREKLERVGPSLPPERAKSYLKAFTRRLNLQVASATRSGKEGRFRFEKVVLPRGNKEVLVLLAEPSKGFLPSDPVLVEPSFLGPGKGPDLVLLRPASVKGMVLAWPGGGGGGKVLAWRLGEGKVLEERNRFLFQSLDFELKGLHPGKWRLALQAQWGKVSFSWGPLLDLHEGERKEGIVLRGETPASLEVFLYGPGKLPLELDTRVILILLAAGPPGRPGEDAPIHSRIAVKSAGAGKSCSFPLLSPGKYKIAAEMQDLVPGGFFSLRRGPQEKGKGKKSPFRVEKEILLRPGPNQVELVFPKLPRMLDLQVFFKDPSGKPIEAGTARLWPRFRWGMAGKPRTSKIGAGGTAFFRDLPPGKFWIAVDCPGFWFEGRELDLSKAEGSPITKEYTLKKAGRIEGKILDAEGVSVSGARIMILGVKGGPFGGGSERGSRRVFMAVSGKKGTFSREVPGGRYRLLSIGPRGRTPEKFVDVDWGKTVRVELRLPK